MSDLSAQQGNQNFNEACEKFKQLLQNPSLGPALGGLLEPLIKGYLANFLDEQRLGCSVDFAYMDNNELKTIHNPGFKTHACKLCKNLRNQNDKDGNSLNTICRNHDEAAIKKLIDRNGEGIEDWEIYEYGGIKRFRFRCDVIGLWEWLIPIYIHDVCVGCFIAGQFYGIRKDDDTVEHLEISDIEQRLDGHLGDHTSVIQNVKDDLFRTVNKEGNHEPEESIEPPIVRQHNFLSEIAELQKSLGEIYNNQLVFYRSSVVRQLLDKVKGKGTLYPEAEKLQGKITMLNIFKHFKFARTNLFDSIITMADLFDLKDAFVFKPQSSTLGLERNETIPGATLIHENKTIADGSSGYDRDFTTSDISIDNDVFNKEAKSHEADDKACPHIEMFLEGNDCKRFLVPTPQDDINDSCIFMCATKGSYDYPLGFFTTLSFSGAKQPAKQERYMDNLNHFFDRLGTAYLVQWNMLVAEYNRLSSENNSLYIQHEVREVMMGLSSIKSMLDKRHSSTLNERVKNSHDVLPPYISELLTYINRYNREYDAYLRILKHVVDNLAALTEKAKLEPSPIGFRAMCEGLEVLNRFNADKSTKHIDFPGYTYPNFIADRTKLEQSLNNLIRNALKYGHEGTNVWVEYGLRNNGTELYFSVTNYGLDIPEVEKEKIFDLGFQSEVHKESRAGGNGIGLYLVKKYAQLHGGDVVLETPYKISDLNVPLIDYYLEKHKQGEIERFGIKEEIVKKCEHEKNKLKHEKQWKKINSINPSNMFSRNKLKLMQELITPSYLRSCITEETYRIKFTLHIPYTKYEIEVDDNDFNHRRRTGW
ncbi:MAG: ATP-binding protein [Defluviitaleaceae bacterium]|nr:ATP-binding protein [Defluviitaleaceae bacterium]